MKWKRFGPLIKAGILDTLQFRLSLVVTVIGNLTYLLLVYYLWKAIFASAGTDVVNGMTFNDTMIYLVFASALFNFMEMWIVWNMGRDIQSGQIVVDLLKPVSYRERQFFACLGECIVKFFTTFLPTFVVVYFVSKGSIKLGVNLLVFVISASMSLVINYYINFIVGTVCMYTDTIWGINIMKVVIVSLLSGATIPLAFFPDRLYKVVMLLPFQAICNTPIELLIHSDMGASRCFELLALQLFWLIFLGVGSELFFRVSIKRITVNGG